MTDDNDTGGLPADGERPAFTPEQEQYMSGKFEKYTEKLTSHFGRIVTKQFEEKFMPKIEANQVDPEKLNEQLSNKLFGGDVNGTVREIIEKYDNEKKSVMTEKQKLITEEMEKFADKPLYKETEDTIRKIADEALAKGFPPAPAVEMAYEKAGRQYLQNKDPEYKLGMSTGGAPPKRTKNAKMPRELKEAAERDIRDGFFKDEKEYLAELSPQMKAKYGV
jgi:hypothetical protein